MKKLILVLLLLLGSTNLLAFKAKDIGFSFIFTYEEFSIWCKKNPECEILSLNIQSIPNEIKVMHFFNVITNGNKYCDNIK